MNQFRLPYRLVVEEGIFEQIPEALSDVMPGISKTKTIIVTEKNLAELFSGIIGEMQKDFNGAEVYLIQGASLDNVSALIKHILTDGFKRWPSEVGHDIKFFKGSSLGMQVLPALAGVGYICGPKISSYMFAGGTLSWFVLMPVIALFGADATVFPGTEVIGTLDPGSLWGTYVRYIGAGAVATGGVISLIKSFPMIVRTFKATMATFGKKDDQKITTLPRTQQDLPMPLVIGLVILLVLLIWLLPTFPVNPLGALLVVIFGFFFAAVSSRMVGLIGSSNNPVSGMAIATLLATTVLLKVTGTAGTKGMVGAIAIGGIICVVAAIAGAISIGYVLDLLNKAWGFGGSEIPAPQGMMMKMIVEGIMNAQLPWGLIFIGVFVAIVIEILGVPVMPVAVGMYLPFSLSAGIMCGGIIRWFVEKRTKNNEKLNKEAVERGTLYTSGLIAGEGLMGILLAVFAVAHLDIDISSKFSIGQVGSLVMWVLMLATLVYTCFGKKNLKYIVGKSDVQYDAADANEDASDE